MKKTPLDPKSKKEVVELLSQLLGSTYVLYTKTQNFHWNLIDPRFSQLHKFFEEQYDELAEAVDEIAERIRMLGEKSPGSMLQFLKLSILKESTEELSADQMLEQLADNHTLIADTLRFWIDESSKRGDEGTTDMMIARLRAHEKQAWMLSSHLTKVSSNH